jgi:hypothetical protein
MEVFLFQGGYYRLAFILSYYYHIHMESIELGRNLAGLISLRPNISELRYFIKSKRNRLNVGRFGYLPLEHRRSIYSH